MRLQAEVRKVTGREFILYEVIYYGYGNRL